MLLFIPAAMTSIDSRNQEKQKAFEEWMKGDHVLLQVDSRAEGIEVPHHLAGNHALVLKLSYLFQGEILHDESGITAYLKFDGDYHKCVIPWSSVWGIVSAEKEYAMWREDLPAEIKKDMAKAVLGKVKQKLFPWTKGDSTERAKPELRAVETPQSPSPEEPSEKPRPQPLADVSAESKADDPNTDGQRRRKPDLKRVK